MLLVAILFLLIPISLVLWLLQVYSYVFIDYKEPWQPISPARCVLALVIPIVMVKWSLRRRSLDRSGASAAFVVGLITTLSNYCFITSVLVFFLSASKATKFRPHQKRKLEHEYREGGQRNWVQVLCNGGIATELAIIYMIDSGCGEHVVDFSRHYTRSWLSMAVLGAIACCSGDTFASELGSVVGKSNPRLITTLKRVPRGTNGGVSFVGTVSSIFGGFIVGLAYYFMLLATVHSDALADSPPQWPIIIMGASAGFIGSVVDSFLGATVQYSGYDSELNCVVEKPGENVEHISGWSLLDNHGVNLLSSLIVASLVPTLAFHSWRRFS